MVKVNLEYEGGVSLLARFVVSHVYVNQKISHETLFNNDTALIVLYATRLYSDRGYNDLVIRYIEAKELLVS